MKRRLTVNSLAMGSLRTGKRSHLTLMTGIVLAIFFSSTMFLMGQSIYQSARLAYERRYGGQDMILYDEDEVKPEMLVESGCASLVGSAYVIGDLKDAELALGYYDGAAGELTGRRCLAGRLPERAGEIAVEEGALNRLRAKAGVGDELTLNFRVPTGHGLEFLPETVQKTYRIVGILEDQIIYQESGSAAYIASYFESQTNYARMPSLIVSPAEQTEPGGRPIRHLLVKFAPGMNAKAFGDYAASMSWSVAADYFGFNYGYAQTEEDGEAGLMFTVVAMLGAVLVLASCLGIVNAFSARLSERRAQIGMLRAVGATRRQIRTIFGREALLIALAAALPAIALSYLVAWGLMKALGDWAVFSVAPWFLPVDAALSIACVMLAAAIPLWDASRASPMQAIRETSLLRAKKRARIRSQMRFDVPRLLAKRHLRLYKARQAGIAGMVALSLAIITMGLYVLSGVSVSEYVWDYDYEITRRVDAGDDLIEMNALQSRFTDGDIDEMAGLPLAAEVAAVKQLRVNLLLDKVTDYVTRDVGGMFPYLAQVPTADVYGAARMRGWEEGDRERWAQARNKYEAFRAQYGISGEALTVNLVSLTPELMEGLESDGVISGRIDMQALDEGREVLIIAPDEYIQFHWEEDGGWNGWSTYATPREGEVFDVILKNDMFFAGDELSLCYLYMAGERKVSDGAGNYDFLTDVSRVDARAKIGAVLAGVGDAWRLVPATWGQDKATLVTTNAGLQALGMKVSGYDGLALKLAGIPDLDTEAHLDEALKNIASRVRDTSLDMACQNARDSKQWALVMTASVLAVVLLFFAVCVSMVNNAITNRVRSDRRAIGTLRAVGAPLPALVSSYRLQTLFMLAGGVVIGVLLSAAFIAWLYGTKNAYTITATPAFLWRLAGAQAGFVALLALLCGVNLRARIRTVTRASIVENVREL